MESILDILEKLVYYEMESLLVIQADGGNVKNRLEELRKIASITQEELADKLEVSRQTIGSLESGRYNPSIQLAFKLSKFFKVTIEELFLYEEENNENNTQ